MTTSARGAAAAKPTVAPPHSNAYAAIRSTALATPRPLNGPGVIDLPRAVASNQPLKVAPQYKAAAIMRRGNPVPPPDAKLNYAQIKALAAIHSGNVAPDDSVTARLILKPGPQLQSHIDADPALVAKHPAVKAQIEKSIGAPVEPKPATAVIPLNAYTGAPKVIQDLAAAHAAQHEGKTIPPAQMAKLQEAGFAFSRNMHANIVDRFFNGALSSIYGAPQFIYHADQALNADLSAIEHGKLPTHLTSEILVPMAKQVAYRWGPLFHGDLGEFAHRANVDPWGYFTDLLAAGSAGVGAAGKLAGAEAGVAAADRAASIENLTSATRTSKLVGGRFVVREQKTGKFAVWDDKEKRVMGAGFPSEADAIEHAKLQGMPLAFQTKAEHAAQAGEPYLAPTPREAGIAGFKNPKLFDKAGGHLLDQWGQRNGWTKERIAGQNQKAVDDLKAFALDAAQNPVRTSPMQGLKNMVKDSGEMLNSTIAYDKARPAELLDKHPLHNRVTARSQATAEVIARELLDATKKATIYLKPAYIAPNMIGNDFMNMAHQGFFAPVELAKSVVLFKHMDPVNLRTMRESMGQSSTEALNAGVRPSRDNPQGYGFVASALHPVVKTFTKITDQASRDAAMLFELRRRGFNKIEDVNSLFDTARAGGPRSEEAWSTIADASRAAQEEIGRFGKFNSRESFVASQIFYVWNWSKTSARYTARFPLQHPALTSGIANAGQLGSDEQQQLTGGEGLPNSLKGKIITGRTPSGDYTVVDPVFGPSTLSSGAQVGRAAYGTVKALSGSKDFSPTSDTSALDMASFPVSESVKALTGRHPNVERDFKNQIPPYRAYKKSQRPGADGLYKSSSTDPLLDWTVGAGFHSKVVSQDAMTAQHEKELTGHAQLELQVKDYTRLRGKPPNPRLVMLAQSDIDHNKIIKSFQSDYADRVAGKNYTQLSPRQQAEAAIEYASKYHTIPQADLDRFAKRVASPGITPARLTHYANAIFGFGGVGRALDKWHTVMSKVKGMQPVGP